MWYQECGTRYLHRCRIFQLRPERDLMISYQVEPARDLLVMSIQLGPARDLLVMIIQLGPSRDLPVMIIQLGPARDLPVMIIQQLKSQPSSTIRVGDNMCTKMQRQLLIRKLCTRIKFLGLYRIFQLHEIPPLEFGGRDCTWAPVYLAGVCSIAHRRHTGVLKCVHREESV